MPVSVQTKNQITDLLERYQSAYNDHNADGLADLLAADVVMYGCRTEEVIVGRESFLSAMPLQDGRYPVCGCGDQERGCDRLGFGFLYAAEYCGVRCGA